MTERNKYNNLWADKLQEVSLPDAGEAWMSMELILDKELPPLPSARRSPLTWRLADFRRWLLLALLLLLLIGVCNCPGSRRWFDAIHTGTPAPAAIVPAANTPSGPAVGPATPASATSVPSAPVPSEPALSSAGPGTPASSSVPSAPSVSLTPPAPAPANATPGTPVRTIVHAPVIPSSSHTPAGGTPANHHITKTPSPGTPPSSHPATPNTYSPGGSRAGHSANPNTGNPTTGSSTPVKSAGSVIPADSPVRVNLPTAKPYTLKGKPVSPAKPDTGATHRPAPSPPPPPSKKDSVHKKQAPPPPGDTTETVKGFVAGIGINQFFPIGGQTSSGYNSGGISGTLSDYIPIPMIRYHFSSKLFVQLEAQFNTPQYTKSNLQVSKTVPDSSRVPVRTVSTVVSLKKLFYFNIPLSIHYNLSDHFSLGAGLQFSRLTNAVGFFDNNIITPGRPDTASSETKSFRGDSIYQRIKTDEFRFLVDFGYTWKHFVVGARYNQALSKFINVQIAPGQITQGRNSSLQLYMRYILWDGRKKKVSVK